MAEGGASSGNTLSLLVVEDDDFMRETMKAMLESINRKSVALHSELKIPALNLRVEYTASGEAAWDLMRAKRFDIALIDLHLPGVSGLDLSWCVKHVPDGGDSQQQAADGSHKTSTLASHETILIACTSDEDARSRITEYGLHDVLPKPVSVMDLRHMLHKWLPRTLSDSITGLPVPQLEQPADLQRNRSGVFAGRVLLVEDDAITRSASVLVFQQLGLCADAAADGKEAMAYMSRRDYDLLLFDVHLPDLSGYALCSWYKAMCRDDGRAIGYVCAVTSDPDLQTCREFEIEQCLPKPLSTPMIVEALRDFWERARFTSAVQQLSDSMHDLRQGSPPDLPRSPGSLPPPLPPPLHAPPPPPPAPAPALPLPGSLHE